MPSGEIKIESLCYHCGSPCDEETIMQEEKQFCCSGCVAVHSILTQSEMGKYYSLEQFPGVKKQKKSFFDFADNEELALSFIDYKNEELTKISIKVPAIHCSSCIWLLENLNLLNPGILRTRVNFQEQQASISFAHQKITLREVLELLDNIGYTPDLGLDSSQNIEAKSSSKLIKQLAFAGFAFGNIMLFSFPEYFGFITSDDHTYGKVFAYLNLLLAIPVVAYSGRDYLKTAYESIKVRSLHIYVPVSIGIIALFSWSTYEIIAGNGAGYFDSLSGLIFFLLIGKWIQEFTNRKLIFNRKYESYFPLSVQLLNGKDEETVPLHSLEEGDRIRVRKGELIPADGYLFRGIGQIDYSFVTGESVPEHKELGEKVYAGGRQLSQVIEIEVLNKVKESKLISLWNNQEEKENEFEAKNLITKTSKVFTIFLLVVALLTFLFWVSLDLNKAVFATVSVLIVACPCALALAYPFATGTAKRLLARGNYYLKNSGVIERLSKTKKIVFDKTGTLSKVMDYESIYIGKSLTSIEQSTIKSLAALSDHPYSKSISKYWSQAYALEIDSFKETPGKGIEGWVKDTWVKLGSESYVFNDEYSSKKEHQVYISINNVYYGAFDFKSNYYPFVKPLIKELKVKNKLFLCTGDTPREEGFLKKEFGFDAMKFKAEPMDKVSYIKELNEDSRDTLYLGDGLNDAGALIAANVGIAVTESLIHFTPASDVIIQNEELDKLPNVLAYSKRVMNVVKLGIVVSAMYNIVGLYFAVQGMLSPIIAAILMPISSITTVVLMTSLTHLYAKKSKII
jgi:Cu+-exporting ATPase